MKGFVQLSAFCAMIMMPVSPALAVTQHVPADFATIQAGLNASANSDTVLVQPGTYFENIVWPQVNGIKLLAAGDSSNTIIDGNQAGRVIRMSSGGLIDTTTLNHGFTVRNGSFGYEFRHGGGIHCVESSPTISNCRITANHVGEYCHGAGIDLLSSSPTIINCRIAGNSTDYEGEGGGIYCHRTSSPIIDGCTFVGNYAWQTGGAISCESESMLRISNCTFEGNRARFGGGVCAWSRSEVDVINCSFTENSSSYGAGIYFEGNYLSLTNGSFTGNNGFSIYIRTADATITNCTISENFGTGIVCLYSDAIISNCMVTNNEGRGMSFEAGSSVLSQCTISGNTFGAGSGIYCLETEMEITDCLIYGNSASGYNNRGGGIYCNSASPTILNCVIRDNTSLNGGGIFCNNGSNPSILNSVISENVSNDVGGGISCMNNSNPTLRNTTIATNSAYLGGGIYCHGESNPLIDNCTISGNLAAWFGAGIFCETSAPSITNSIVSLNEGEGLYVEDEQSSPELAYCTIYDNSDGDFGGQIDPELGVIVGTNANGDPCDAYYNISLDPMYVDGENGDFHLLEESPCIDAGDPTSPFDPDGSVADIGAFYFDQNNVGVRERNPADNPLNWTLTPAYPNPFNPTTTITVNLPEATDLNVTVYNVSGQQVAELASGQYATGQHNLTFDASGLASGLYFIHATVPGKLDHTQKVMLVR
jgi:Right handed beta helix region/Secretion system C-terminal sorting domain